MHMMKKRTENKEEGGKRRKVKWKKKRMRRWVQLLYPPITNMFVPQGK